MSDEHGPRPDPALLRVVFARSISSTDLYEAQHATTGDSWTVRPLSELNVTGGALHMDTDPHATSDGLVIVFGSDRSGDYKLYLATRPSVADPFGPPTELAFRGADPWLSDDRHHLVYVDGILGTDNDLYEVWLP